MLCLETDTLLDELLRDQESALRFYFEHLDRAKLQKVFEVLGQCAGTLFFCGVGKSGYVAEKVAMTLVSTGTKAQPLSAVNALHGDLGGVGDQDIVLFFSKSGETEDLVNLVSFVRAKGARSLAVTCREQSRLSALCDMEICLPLEQELCPFDLAPTTSPALQILFGDLLVVALMRLRDFTLDAYAKNHPLGRIGKRMTLRVHELMLRGEDVPRCSGNQPLQDVLVELSSKRCGCVLICGANGEIEGIFTDGDLRRSLEKEGADVLKRSMRELMNVSPRTVGPHLLAWEAMQAMEEDMSRPVMVLPVVEQGRLVGLLKLHDIIQAGL